MNYKIWGKVFLCGDNVTAYQIIPRNRWTLGLDEGKLGKWAMEGVCSEFLNAEDAFKKKGCSIIIGGQDFGGGGKSIEHPIAALQGAGVKLLIAESFSRYAFRNAINRGLPAIPCPGITSIVHEDDEIEANLLTGKIRNITTGAEIKGIALPPLVLSFAEHGGMLAYYREKYFQAKYPAQK